MKREHVFVCVKESYMDRDRKKERGGEKGKEREKEIHHWHKNNNMRE